MVERFEVLNRVTDLIANWLRDNMLKLNPDKNEFITISPNLNIPLRDSIVVEGAVITRSESLKILGVTIDTRLSFHPHILQTCRTSLWLLSDIRRIRQRLDQSTAEIMINSFVLSRIDYCNAIYSGLPNTTLNPLTTVLNAAARLITHTRRFDHITPALRELHWLPIPQRITFKIAVLVYKCIHGLAPPHLSLRISHAQSDRLFDQGLLHIPLRTCNSFNTCGPTIWNNLPLPLRCNDTSLLTFRKLLKSHLFNIAYN